MKGMREKYLPVLEANGIDLVICGHSHVYERSYLIQKHYGTSGGFNRNTHMVDSTSGNPDTEGPYVKYTYGPNKDKGTVYAVVGNSGKTNETVGALPCMLKGLANNEVGSMILNVKGNTLTATYYKSDGTEFDKFAIVKKDTTVATNTRPSTQIESIQVYPNPFKKELWVELSLKKTEQLKISITAVDGKSTNAAVWTGNAPAGKMKIDLSDNVRSLPAGNYLLHVEDKEGGVAEKIVKL
jgi:hypothetical protein